MKNKMLKNWNEKKKERLLKQKMTCYNLTGAVINMFANKET